jgi:hypothetical protein
VFVHSRTRYTEDAAREAIAASRSWSEALRRLGMRSAGGNWLTLRKWAGLWGIPHDHFDPRHSQRLQLAARTSRPLADHLVAGSRYSRASLKRRLFQEGLKRRECELCGLGEEWNGRPMGLILDHVNGVADDNRLENLRIVCPNCAATLDTHCGRNKPRVCAGCAQAFRPRSRTQRYCSHRCWTSSEAHHAVQLRHRRVPRPSYEQLLADLRELSYVAVGRKYGVSDNAVRKWLRRYERERAKAA